MLHFEDAKNYKKEIKHLYRTAFPKEERAPLFILYSKTKSGNNHFYAIVEDDAFTGLLYTIEDVSTEDSKIPVYVVQTNEELMIALDTYEIISK